MRIIPRRHPRVKPIPLRIRRPLATPADEAIAVAAFLAGREPPVEPWEDTFPRAMTHEEQARAMWENAREYREMQGPRS